jgi:hypothetical protein
MKNIPIAALLLSVVWGSELHAQTTYEEVPPDQMTAGSEPPMAEEPSEEPTRASSPSSAGPFAKGKVRLSFMAGYGRAIGQDYLLLGGGAAYYLLDGLEAGLDFEAWLIGDPSQYRLSPQVRYVFYWLPVVMPYVGGFYRHSFITDGLPDLDSFGTRVGLVLNPTGRFYISGGAVFEFPVGCDDRIYNCDTQIYPEIAFSAVF